jgi:hypothetical protein
MGIETEYAFERIKFEYQNILDNVTLLDDETVCKLNDVVVEMGHGVFKKRCGSLALKDYINKFANCQYLFGIYQNHE